MTRQKHVKRHRYSPYATYGYSGIFGGVVLFLCALYYGVVWWVAYFIAINSTAFALFGFDKAIAGGRHMRVPERVFYILAIAGASPALFVGQFLFHHKTIKTSFRIVFFLIIAAQCVAVLYLFSHYDIFTF